MAIPFIDLCSGIGGFHSGLVNTGHYRCVGHAEIDKNAEKAYNAIYGEEGGLNYGDLRTINPRELPHFDLLCGGFPCQSFSVAGRRLGFRDTRGTVFFEIARILAEKRPPFLLLENVLGLLSHDSGRTLNTIFSALVEMGYNLEWMVLNSKYFGVPQQRRRLYIVGYLDPRCAGKVFSLGGGNAKNLKQLIPGPQGQRVYETDGIACTQCAGSGGWGGKTGLYFIDMNADPVITDVARCITARQDSGVSNHRGEHSAVLIEDAPRAILTPDRETVRQQGRRMKEPNPENIALKAKAEKYAKIIAKTLIFSDGDAASYGQNAFFYDAAEGLMTAVILLIAEFAPPEQRHIVSVFKLIQDLLAPSGVKGKNQFQLLIEKLPPEHKTRWFAGAALNTSDQAMASIMSTAMSRLNAFLDSELEQILCFDTAIDAEKFCSNKCAIFIVLPEENPATYFMVSLLLQQLYREILTVADEHGGALKNRVMFYMDEFGTLPAISSAEMMYSASRSRKLSLVSIIQSYKQLEKNYGNEGADIIKDNCQVTIAGGFAPTSGTADEISKSLGTRTVMTGSVSRSKNDPSQSLQMTERPLMTADELKSMKKGNFIVMKTGTHPFVSKLKLFFKWGIEFDTEKYTVPDKGARKVSYTNKEIIENNMLEQYPDSYYLLSRSARRSASGGQALSQSNEPLFREPEQSVRTD